MINQDCQENFSFEGLGNTGLQIWQTDDLPTLLMSNFQQQNFKKMNKTLSIKSIVCRTVYWIYISCKKML